MAKRALWGTLVGAVAATAVAGTVALAVPAGAETAGQAVAAGQAASVADNTALCDRLKKADAKRQAVATRLDGDANTRGSIAWLNAKAAAATSSGDTALAKLYTDRANLRTQILDPLKTIDTDLQAVIAVKCG
jgi:hypothetical protein